MKIQSLVLSVPVIALTSLYLAGPGRDAVGADASEKTRSAEAVTIAPTDWPWWRGPTRNGVARPDQKPPLSWSQTKNVIWRASVPGRGHGSPTVLGNHVVLATADEATEVQSVLCFDRDSGERQWQTEVHNGGIEKEGNKKASQASCTVASDGTRYFINFLNGNAVHTTALDREGNRLWQTKISDYVTHQGYGSSPSIYRNLVIVSADNKGGGAVCGLDRATGDVVWKTPRPATPNYPSPIILPLQGRDQLLFSGCNLVTSFDPLTGQKSWEVEGSTTECVTSTVTDGNLVFTSGGYPDNHVSGIRADGSGEIAWKTNTRVYVPSMLVHEGHLYAVTDAGVAICWKSDTGERRWRQRLEGSFSPSPVLVGDTIFATNQSGKTFIFKANPGGYQALGENVLGEEVYATPVFCGSRIYMRVASYSGEKRSEALFCLASR